MEDKVKTIQFAALTLSKELDNGETATLCWKVRGIYPRIVVNTGNAINDDKTVDYSKVIIAPFDYATMKTFLYYLYELTKAKQPVSYSVDCYNVVFKDGVKTNDIEVQATVTVGRDTDGINFITVTREGKMKVKFDLIPNPKWFVYKKDNDANLINKEQLSGFFVKGYYSIATKLLETETLLSAKDEYLTNKPSYITEEEAKANKTKAANIEHVEVADKTNEKKEESIDDLLSML